MKTQQEVFDQVVEHLMTQRARSVNPNLSGNNCAYRGIGGLSCAVGCLIPDEMYHPNMEGKAVGNLIQYRETYGYQLPPEILDYEFMLNQLQRVHDNHMPVSHYANLVTDDERERHEQGMLRTANVLYDVALNYELSPNAVKKYLK